jgi:hypothetical protein
MNIPVIDGNAAQQPIQQTPPPVPAPAPVAQPEAAVEDDVAETPEELRDRAISWVDAGKNEEEIAREFGLRTRDAIEFSIRRHYDKGRGSIQDYARIYRLEVSEVNEILEQTDVNTIQMIGDLIDQAYAGKVPVNETGETYHVPFDLR